jgi:hypothetical protein
MIIAMINNYKTKTIMIIIYYYNYTSCTVPDFEMVLVASPPVRKGTGNGLISEPPPDFVRCKQLDLADGAVKASD